MDVNKLTAAYVNLRDARKKLADEFKEKDGELKDKQEVIEAEMLRFMNDSNMDSVKTPAGTFYRQENLRPSASDWDVFYAWIKDNDAFEALERRVKKDFVKNFMEENKGELPPGVSVYREFVARVRRA
jgi:hypothetical protein